MEHRWVSVPARDLIRAGDEQRWDVELAAQAAGAEQAALTCLMSMALRYEVTVEDIVALFTRVTEVAPQIEDVHRSSRARLDLLHTRCTIALGELMRRCTQGGADLEQLFDDLDLVRQMHLDLATKSTPAELGLHA